jgi:thiamine pyrophosphokinase
MRAAIAVNGLVHDYTALAALLRPEDCLIGADGGTDHWLAIGRTPQIVVGDLDSLSPQAASDLAAQGVLFEQHPPDKDQTDLELAIERALAEGAQEVLIVGALGGRLDQTLANLLILAQRSWSVPVRVVEGSQIAQVLRGPGSLTLHGSPGDTLSLLPLSATVEGLTYTGLRYPLQNATLSFGSTRGVSNTLSGTCATVTLRSGVALIIQTLHPSSA